MTTMKNGSGAYSAARSASKDVVVGFHEELRAIQDKLCGESSSRQVIPIVGMGGIGKTTLASIAYHDPLIRGHFHIGGWVTISQSYSLEDIISRLHQSLNLFNEENGIQTDEEKDYPGDLVYKTLKGRRYLVVIDDIWNTEVFDRLKRLFPDDKNGSRVMLTTRLQDVATYANNCSRHEMRMMSEEQSWTLLQQKVFIHGVCDEELQDIGMAIARSCRGLPLAIVAISGLLATMEKTRAAWAEIAEKVSSTLAAKDSQFEKILSLSYTNLPHHLKQCFVYMGGFPEDRKINVAKLIKLWIAEGFIDATDASKSLEEEAGECLHDLIKRNLVLVGKRKPPGEIKNCSLHDLMRDLCIRKADEEKLLMHGSDDYRSYLEIFLGLLKDVRYPRVLDCGIYVPQPSPVGPGLYALAPEKKLRLTGLRYISLALYVEIPAAISVLENLQTFIIYPMEGLIRLPPEIWTMPQVRHLISSFDALPSPEGEARMESLQTLSEVNNLEFTDMLVGTIRNIKKLRLLYSASYDFLQNYYVAGFYGLHQPEDLSNHYDYHLEKLERLHHLEKLKMRVYLGSGGILNPVFPQSLKKLSLSGWRVPSWNDMNIIGSLPNLQVLKLRDSGGQDEKWETAEGEFTQLSFLFIERSDLREWKTEGEHFPKLKQLLLHYCGYLKEIPSDIGEIPTLELIEVREGNTFLVESVRRIEEEQKDNANDSLKISCI